jgi:hypothetical protein
VIGVIEVHLNIYIHTHIYSYMYIYIHICKNSAMKPRWGEGKEVKKE